MLTYMSEITIPVKFVMIFLYKISPLIWRCRQFPTLPSFPHTQVQNNNNNSKVQRKTKLLTHLQGLVPLSPVFLDIHKTPMNLYGYSLAAVKHNLRQFRKMLCFKAI